MNFFREPGCVILFYVLLDIMFIWRSCGFFISHFYLPQMR